MNQPRLLQRAIRQNALIRRKATKELLLQTINKFIPSIHPTFQPMIDAVGNLTSAESTEGGGEMPLVDDEFDSTPCDTVIPEVEVFWCVSYYIFGVVKFDVYAGLYFHAHCYHPVEA